MDMSRLDALNLNLFNERRRLSAANTDASRNMRSVWVGQIWNEIKHERPLLGLPLEEEAPHISDDELLAEKGAFGS